MWMVKRKMQSLSHLRILPIQKAIILHQCLQNLITQLKMTQLVVQQPQNMLTHLPVLRKAHQQQLPNPHLHPPLPKYLYVILRLTQLHWSPR